MASAARAAFRPNHPKPAPGRAVHPRALLIALLPILTATTAPAQPGFELEPGLVANGDFTDLTTDDWIEGWERIAETADSEAEAVTRGQDVTVRLTGKTTASRAGLKTRSRTIESRASSRARKRARAPTTFALPRCFLTLRGHSR